MSIKSEIGGILCDYFDVNQQVDKIVDVLFESVENRIHGTGEYAPDIIMNAVLCKMKERFEWLAKRCKYNAREYDWQERCFGHLRNYFSPDVFEDPEMRMFYIEIEERYRKEKDYEADNVN